MGFPYGEASYAVTGKADIFKSFYAFYPLGFKH